LATATSALPATSFEIVAFLDNDDDVVATHNCLAALVAPFADSYVLGFGGPRAAGLARGASGLVPRVQPPPT
jgi:hypothetical protein